MRHLNNSLIAAPIFTNNGVWEHVESASYFRGTTVSGVIHVTKILTPMGFTAWKFEDNFGTTITIIHAPNCRNCRLVQALFYFDRKYLAN